MYVHVKNLSKHYQSGDIATQALNTVSLKMDKGKIGVILGPSGSGKSTLMNILGGIDRADSGEVIIGDTTITNLSEDALTEYRRAHVGFVFQSYNLIPHLNVLENIEVAENISHNPLSVDQVLEAVGLSHKKSSFPRELSGGEQQRVSIARAIVKNPDMLLCDELTGALDYDAAVEVLSLVQKVSQQFGTTVLIITHNTTIAEMAHHVWQLSSGSIVHTRQNEQPKDARGVVW